MASSSSCRISTLLQSTSLRQELVSQIVDKTRAGFLFPFFVPPFVYGNGTRQYNNQTVTSVLGLRTERACVAACTLLSLDSNVLPAEQFLLDTPTFLGHRLQLVLLLSSCLLTHMCVHFECTGIIFEQRQIPTWSFLEPENGVGESVRMLDCNTSVRSVDHGLCGENEMSLTFSSQGEVIWFSSCCRRDTDQ